MISIQFFVLFTLLTLIPINSFLTHTHLLSSQRTSSFHRPILTKPTPSPSQSNSPTTSTTQLNYMVKHLTPEQFNDHVKFAKNLTVVYFYSQSAYACHRMKPIFKNVSMNHEFVNVPFYALDYDKNIPLVEQLDIYSLPFYGFFYNGVMIFHMMGYLPHERLLMITRAVNQYTQALFEQTAIDLQTNEAMIPQMKTLQEITEYLANNQTKISHDMVPNPMINEHVLAVNPSELDANYLQQFKEFDETWEKTYGKTSKTLETMMKDPHVLDNIDINSLKKVRRQAATLSSQLDEEIELLMNQLMELEKQEQEELKKARQSKESNKENQENVDGNNEKKPKKNKRGFRFFKF